VSLEEVEMIGQEILRALHYLVISGVVYGAYSISSNAESERYPTLFKGLLWCAGIALAVAITLGDPACIEDSPLGGCALYEDDGLKPSTEQRIATFAHIFTLVSVPVGIGAFRKSRHR
jgi:hypothetical protein